MVHAFTSGAPNYIGKVRTLCRSLRQHCPDWKLHWLVPDFRRDELVASLEDGEVDYVWFVDDLPGLNQRSWLFQHDIVEISTALKPKMALQILNRADCEALFYLDPDIVVFSPLDDLLESLMTASVTLTPHLLEPEVAPKAVHDHELSSLRHGVFNLGFFGVRECEESRKFLEWWSERCEAFCWSDWRSGVFTDQKWLNFAPVFFPATCIVRSPRFNVAPWNINQRRLEGTFDEGFRVEGEPLGFYHFTGFDSGSHAQALSAYAANNQATKALISWYEKRTGFLTPGGAAKWALGTYDNGQPIRAADRRIYRERADLQAAFPDPYRVGPGQSFLDWLAQNGPP